MSLMERTRELGVDDARIEESTVAAARGELMRGITGDAPARRMSRWAPIGIGGLVAGAAVATVVVGSVIAPGAAPSASASEVLTDAAQLTIQAGDISVPAGKYLRITSNDEVLRFWDADMPADPGAGWMRFNNGDRTDAEAALMMRSSTAVFVPADRDAEWVSVTEPPVLVEVLGAQQEQARADAEQDPSRPESAEPMSVRAMGGAYEQADGVDGEGTITSYLDGRQLWTEMPTVEPRALLTWLRARVGEAPDSTASDSSIVETLVEDPTIALASPGTRGAVLGVLALLDGSSVRSVDGAVTTIRFSWETKWWSAWKDIEIDTERGLIVGVTSSGALTEGTPSVRGLPAWNSRSTYEITVVDTAP